MFGRHLGPAEGLAGGNRTICGRYAGCEWTGSNANRKLYRQIYSFQNPANFNKFCNEDVGLCTLLDGGQKLHDQTSASRLIRTWSDNSTLNFDNVTSIRNDLKNTTNLNNDALVNGVDTGILVQWTRG